MADHAARIVGWDVGGAHLKAARAVGGMIVQVAQHPTPIWQGLDCLHAALDALLPAFGPADRHVVTMTAELADHFATRTQGVVTLAELLAAALAPAPLRLYGGRDGWIEPPAAAAHAGAIASANWHASAALLARHQPDALLIDIGSTTADLIPVAGGQIAAAGYSDAERLASGELVYTGLTRSPPMSLGPRAPFAGGWTELANECFASMADVRRILGDLPAGADQMAQPDGRGQSIAESEARLARLIGRDAADASAADWRRLAAWFAEQQLRRISDGAHLVVSRGGLAATAPVVGAGVGRGLAAQVAARLGLGYRDYAEAIGAAAIGLDDPGWLATCAPAAAVALLA